VGATDLSSAERASALHSWFVLLYPLFSFVFSFVFQFTFLSRGTSIRQSSLPPAWPNLQIDSKEEKKAGQPCQLLTTMANSPIPGRRERSGFLEDLWAGDVTFPLSYWESSSFPILGRHGLKAPSSSGISYLPPLLMPF